jgi:DNA (cytosine-5)-methyltransferase 1
VVVLNAFKAMQKKRRVFTGTFIDLFAGCGGLSLGLLRAGWKGLFAVESDSMAFDTLRANLIDRPQNPRFEWVQGLRKRPYHLSTILRNYCTLLSGLRGEVDLVAGGPPCQGFSVAGKRDISDPRNKLMWQYIKFVKLVQPKLLLIENVRGMAVTFDGQKEPYSARFLRALEKIGYACFPEVHKASEFGVPQERPRYIIVGLRKRSFSREVIARAESRLPSAIEGARVTFLAMLGLSATRPVSVRDAISDLKGQALEPCPDARKRKQVRYKRPRTKYQRILHGSLRGEMNSMRLASHLPATKKKFKKLIRYCRVHKRMGVQLNSREREVLRNKKQTVVVLHPDKPSHTLTTLPDDLLHYSHPRILTVREYARLQSFPDWFQFRGKYTTGGDLRVRECPRYTQVGNAVAPFVAQVLGSALIGLLVDLEEGAHTRVVRRRVAVHA